ncbi:hypothetical protein [Mycobacterium bourgelatii]|uniref:hypothetical protein n=1 Tax=Mycobacterium bourgelatii TaxID=1273442 RepID=UPI0013CFFF48|nr:hypothetical protein [Mycobacterium bourgelatii]MCV6978006.1 hypothetical protein [Mycobacterium bourgelatii]
MGAPPHGASASTTASSAADITGTLLSLSAGVEPMTEVMPLDQASATYERMMAGESRLRELC